MGGGPTTGQGQRPGAAGRWPKLASPGAAAAGLGGLGLALLAAWVLLTALTRDVQVSRDGAAVVFAVGTGLLGLLLARRQPQNPEGWLLLGPAAAVLAVLDGGLYAVLDYRMHHGRLPLGETAVFIRGGLGPPLLFVVALVILLFPDGRLTRRWTWVLWLYLGRTPWTWIRSGPIWPASLTRRWHPPTSRSG